MSVSKNRVPQNGWFIVENLIKMDDLGVTTIFGNIHMSKITRGELITAQVTLQTCNPHHATPGWLAGLKKG